MRKTYVLLILPVVFVGCENFKTKPDRLSPVQKYTQIDEFNDALANRAKDKIKGDDFIVLATEPIWSIGTVLRSGQTVPDNATACIVASEKILTASMPSLFPIYTNTFKNTIGLSLADNFITKLVDAGVNITDKDEVSINVEDTKLTIIDNSTYHKLSSNKECGSILAGKELLIVRGYVSGKRSFVFSSNIDQNAKAKIEKIGSFNVDFGSGSRVLKVTDKQPEKFIEILSAIKIEQGVIEQVSPSTPTGSGRIFIQKDKQDKSGVSEAVVKSLRDANYEVENSVESIDSSKMPRIAQVRYFNDVDRNLANQVAENLKSKFPNIFVMKLKLPAPTGQLEVWLPRVGAIASN